MIHTADAHSYTFYFTNDFPKSNRREHIRKSVLMSRGSSYDRDALERLSGALSGSSGIGF